MQGQENEVTEDEVKAALLKMSCLKSPGTDGIPTIFYQEYWEVMQEDMWQAIRHLFLHKYMLKEWNYSHICLIFKVERPK